MIDPEIIVLFLFHILVAFGAWYAAGRAKVSQPFRELWSDWHFHTDGGEVYCEHCDQVLSALNTRTDRGYICPGCKGECKRLPHAEPFLLDMIECPACLGFWFGVLFSITAVSSLSSTLVGVFSAPLFGFATLATNLIIAKKTGLM